MVEHPVVQCDHIAVLHHHPGLAGDQAAGGAGLDDHRGLGRVKAQLVVGGGVFVVEGQREAGMEAEAEAQLSVAGVGHGDGLAQGAAVQHEGAFQRKVPGQLFAGLLIGAQHKAHGAVFRAHKLVLEVPAKAVLAALPGLAVQGVGAAVQLAAVGEQDGRAAGPHILLAVPHHLGAGCLVHHAHQLGTLGLHGHGQKFIFDGMSHKKRYPFLFIKDVT